MGQEKEEGVEAATEGGEQMEQESGVNEESREPRRLEIIDRNRANAKP